MYLYSVVILMSILSSYMLQFIFSPQMLSDNRIWRTRTVDIGVISAEQALAWGCR